MKSIIYFFFKKVIDRTECAIPIKKESVNICFLFLARKYAWLFFFLCYCAKCQHKKCFFICCDCLN